MKTINIAKAIIIDANDNVLILRRSESHPTLAFEPDLPGGLVEDNEEPGEAVVRETQEETGLKLLFTDLKLIYAGANHFEETNRVRLLYVAKLSEVKPHVVISWEHNHWEWTALANIGSIEEKFHGFYKEGLRYIRANKLLEDL